MHQSVVRAVCISLLLICTACQTAPQSEVEQRLFNPDQIGVRWGLVVTDMDGNELIALKPDDRFTPASNVKIITTMAAYENLDALIATQAWSGTQVLIEHDLANEHPSLILQGGGDAMLQDHAECEQSCLADLADQVAALGFAEFSGVIGDDTVFPFERWGPGWSLEDIQFSYGTAVSALSVNDNLVGIDIAPASNRGALAEITWQAGDAYLTVQNELVTVAADVPTDFGIERQPGTKTVRIYGTLAEDAAPIQFNLAVDSPAEYAALRFKRLLEARGMKVGTIGTRHRPLDLADLPPDPELEIARPVMAADTASPSAGLPATPITETLHRISKESQNLHAEILLRRLGHIHGTGSRAHGVRLLETFLSDAGLPEQAYALHGGSGMSTYNRVTPRGMVQLLTFASQQDWFEDWLADQPIGGVDGTLERRFIGTPLEGKVFAKTGTLRGVNALSGVMIAHSGQQLLFSIFANDRPATSRSAIAEMDAALVEIAARY